MVKKKQEKFSMLFQICYFTKNSYYYCRLEHVQNLEAALCLYNILAMFSMHEGAPPVPKDINIDVLNTTNMELTVNLTWALNHRCVQEYYVEVTNTDTSTCIKNSTTLQYIILTLQTGVVYSFKVRGADRAGRGKWSEVYIHASGEPNIIECYNSPVTNTVDNNNTCSCSHI